MLKVREELCIGCGLCVRSCPTGAINLTFGKAYIDEKKCTQCHRCQTVCPRGAIVEITKTTVSLNDFKYNIQNLKEQVDKILHKIEELKGN